MPRRKSKKVLHKISASIPNVSSLSARSETPANRDCTIHSANTVTVPPEHNHKPPLFKEILLLQFKMPLDISIIESIWTPTRTNCLPPLPPFPLTPSQRQVLKAPTPQLVRFPTHLFPQLHQFENVCREKAHLKMDPLPLNWEYTYRPNRPFEKISQPRSQDQVPPTPPPRPSVKAAEPTAYYLEQVYLAREDPNFLLLVTEPAIVERLRFRVWVEAVAAFLMMLVGSGVGAAAYILGWAKLAFLWCLWCPLKTVGKVILETEWEMYLAVALAAQVARFLPGVEEGVGREMDGVEKPLYVVFWGVEHSRFATGAVWQDSGVL